MQPVTITLRQERATKNTVRFVALDPNGVCDLIYIEKAAFAGKPAPAFLEISITPRD
jgi:hypothetical protein